MRFPEDKDRRPTFPVSPEPSERRYLAITLSATLQDTRPNGRVELREALEGTGARHGLRIVRSLRGLDLRVTLQPESGASVVLSAILEDTHDRTGAIVFRETAGGVKRKQDLRLLEALRGEDLLVTIQPEHETVEPEELET